MTKQLQRPAERRVCVRVIRREKDSKVHISFGHGVPGEHYADESGSVTFYLPKRWVVGIPDRDGIASIWRGQAASIDLLCYSRVEFYADESEVEDILRGYDNVALEG